MRTTTLWRGLATALVALILCGCWSDIPTYPPPPYPPPVEPPPIEPPPPTEEPNVLDEVKVGMTEAEVIALLGPYDPVPQGSGSTVTRRWTVVIDEETYLLVCIFNAQGVMTARRVFKAGGGDAGG